MAYASIPVGAVTLFNQSTAPVKWTRSTTYNDYTLRVVTGGVSSGGTNPFTTINTTNVSFGGGSYLINGITIGPATAPVPGHSHSLANPTSPFAPTSRYYYVNNTPSFTNAGNGPALSKMSGGSSAQSGATGGGAAHTHTYSASPNYGPFAVPSNSWSWKLAYIDNILATRTG
jgi:hypothetical protein